MSANAKASPERGPSAIVFEARRKTFHLRGANSSYVMAVAPDGDLQHLHWGSPLSDADLATVAGIWTGGVQPPFLENHAREFGDFGRSDLRAPALLLSHPDGSRISEFRYQDHEIVDGLPSFSGPQVRDADPAEAMTLRIRLSDSVSGQDLDLYWGLLPSLDVIVRRAVLIQARGECVIRRLMSASVDFPAGDWRSLSLPGDWARERMVQETRLAQGTQRFECARGSQSHRMAPFAAFTCGDAQEAQGQAWGVAPVYSGNWLIECETHASGRLRVNLGMNDFDFSWRLAEGSRFESPESVLVYSPGGLDGLSRRFHTLVRRHVCRGPWRDRPRPVLLNSWEAHYMEFDHAKLVALAEGAKELGVELLVLDDGWFGRRDRDDSSLGDWHDDLRKLPHGVAGLSKEIHAMGLLFGLWFEPEAISPDSDLFRAHPDWALKVAGREPTPARNQMVLDLSRSEVRDHLFERLCATIDATQLDYIKWDMNRPLWDVGNPTLPAERQVELRHRWLLGTYELLDRLQKRYPGLLLEGCTGGGGRFDLGMLCYYPQFWTSDNTDGINRIYIQHGSSLFLPPVTQGDHVSESPNHQTGRITPLKLRCEVAMAGNFGLELEPERLSDKERDELKGHISRYKRLRPLIHSGEFHRIADPFKGPRAAWLIVGEGRREAVLFVYQPRADFLGFHDKPLLLRGLDASLTYEVPSLDRRHSGAYLMDTGLTVALSQRGYRSGAGDYQSGIFELKAV